jgi:hypothetical protein
MLANINYSYHQRSMNRKDAFPSALGSPRSGMGRMSDYIADTPYRVLQTTGGQGGRALGPLSYPIMTGPKIESDTDILRDIRALLERMPASLQDEFRTRFIIQPRESISFNAGSGDVIVGPGLAVAVVSEVVDPRFTGFLTHVGVNVIAPGSFSSILWQIRINGAIHPKYANRVFSASTLSDPLPFAFELTQSRTVELVAVNPTGAPITVQGLLVGWTEFMSTYKSYGSSPQSGVA